MSCFDVAFGVPAGHTLREVRSSPRACGPDRDIWEWEHEEYNARGVLAAVYESWTRDAAPSGAGGPGAILCWVKYSPYGWVLSRAGAMPVRRGGIAVAACAQAA